VRESGQNKKRGTEKGDEKRKEERKRGRNGERERKEGKREKGRRWRWRRESEFTTLAFIAFTPSSPVRSEIPQIILFENNIYIIQKRRWRRKRRRRRRWTGGGVPSRGAPSDTPWPSTCSLSLMFHLSFPRYNEREIGLYEKE